MIIHDFRPKTTPPRQYFTLSPHQRMLLMPIGDVHYGAAGFPSKRFQQHIAWGIKHGAYFLAMGDIMEFTSRSQRGHLANMRASQRAIIDEENAARIARFAALVPQSKGRWIGWLKGDHYHEFLDGTTSDQRLCQALGGVFLGTCSLLQLRLTDARRAGPRNKFGQGCDVTLYVHHGKGAPQLVGSNLHILERLVVGFEADIYLMAHSHTMVTAPIDRLYRTDGGYLYHRTKLLARTGGWLRGYQAQRPSEGRPAYESCGSYVEEAAYRPSTIGGVVLSLGYKRVRHETAEAPADFYVPDIHISL